MTEEIRAGIAFLTMGSSTKGILPADRSRGSQEAQGQTGAGRQQDTQAPVRASALVGLPFFQTSRIRAGDWFNLRMQRQPDQRKASG